jgi:hypothetical protein
MYLGETGKISSLPFARGGLGWGNLRNNSKQENLATIQAKPASVG